MSPIANMKKKTKNKNGVENWLGYCPTVSQYNEKLYCDTAGFGGLLGLVVSVSQYNHCIMTVVQFWLKESVLQ